MKVVLECGKAHGGNITLAKDMILRAKDAGADAVKFQCYDREDLIKKHPNYEKNLNAHLSLESLKLLSDYAESLGINFWCSAFSTSVLKPLSKFTSVIKVPSTYLTHKKFLDACVQLFKAVHISTGMHTIKEIKKVQELHPDFLYYHCVSEYPCYYPKLDRIETLDMDGCSYHGKNFFVPGIAMLKGASFLEIHFNPYKQAEWEWDEKDVQGVIKNINLIKAMCFDDELLSAKEILCKGFYLEEYKTLKGLK